MAGEGLGSGRIEEHPLLGQAPERRVVTATFDGEPVQGYEGEPIAATLLAHGIRVFRTMVETGEPRGLFTGTGRTLDEVLVVDGQPNVMATTTPLREGTVIETQRGLGEWRRSS